MGTRLTKLVSLLPISLSFSPLSLTVLVPSIDTRHIFSGSTVQCIDSGRVSCCPGVQKQQTSFLGNKTPIAGISQTSLASSCVSISVMLTYISFYFTWFVFSIRSLFIQFAKQQQHGSRSCWGLDQALEV